MHSNRRAIAGALVAGLALLGAACSDDDEDTAETGSAPEEETTTTAEGGEPEGEVVEVTAVEYAYEGLPETIAAGTTLSLKNEGEEPHELIAIRIPDAETRPVSELVALPEAELGAVFGGEPEPSTVILAASGQTDTPGPVVGDGSLTEPGRYVVACFLPVGADDSILESEGPPESDAPPHVSQGMFAEVTVE